MEKRNLPKSACMSEKNGMKVGWMISSIESRDFFMHTATISQMNSTLKPFVLINQ